MSFQSRVLPWLQACFSSEVLSDKLERGDRLLEETVELLQSTGYPRERIAALVDYVYDRPSGDVNKEVGGVMVTLAAFCVSTGVDMHTEAETELARISQPAMMLRIQAKHASKPTGTALPGRAE